MSSSETPSQEPERNQPFRRPDKKLVPILTAQRLRELREGRFEVKHFKCGCHQQDCVFLWDTKFDKWVSVYEKDIFDKVIWDGNKLFDRQRHQRHDTNSWWRWKQGLWGGTTPEKMRAALLEKVVSG